MRFLTILLFFLLALVSCRSEELHGHVVSVIDGDTIWILMDGNNRVKVRLSAIDAPEKKQAFGNASRQALAAMVAGKNVTVEKTGLDRWNRVLGWVSLGGEDINRRMIADGWAWHFVRYDKSPELDRLENEARKAKRGIWADQHPVAPWVFRKLGKNTKRAFSVRVKP